MDWSEAAIAARRYGNPFVTRREAAAMRQRGGGIHDQPPDFQRALLRVVTRPADRAAERLVGSDTHRQQSFGGAFHPLGQPGPICFDVQRARIEKQIMILTIRVIGRGQVELEEREA